MFIEPVVVSNEENGREKGCQDVYKMEDYGR